MIWLYNLLWLLILPGVVWYLALRRMVSGKYRQNLKCRLGLGFRFKGKPRSRRTIWVHALSVGEVLSVASLVHALRKEFPEYQIAISTTTEFGQLVARQKFSSLDCRFFYMPLDLWWLVQRIVKHIDARLFVLVETDLWPNLLWCLGSEKTPIILVNGRLSVRSFNRYRHMRKLLCPTMQSFTMLCVQSSEDARRLLMLGVEEHKIRVTGNLKFDQPSEIGPAQEREELMRELGWISSWPTWIAGSTHPGEERVILSVYSRLRRRYSEFRLVLAPRNPERFSEVAALAEQVGCQSARRSRLQDGRGGEIQVDLLVLDTIGELARFYSLGNFAFLGGSLVSVGGHNPLEAARRGLPVVFGPNMENFREIAAILRESGGGFQVHDEAGLFDQVATWLAFPAACREQGERAQAAVLLHRGALERNMEVIRGVLQTAGV